MAQTPSRTPTDSARSQRGRRFNVAFMVGIVGLALLLATIGAAAEPEADTPGSPDASTEAEPEADEQADGTPFGPEHLLEDFAAALGDRLGTDVAPADIEGAVTDVVEQYVQEAVEAGRLTQEQADAILEELDEEGLFSMPRRFRFHAPEGFQAPGPMPFPFGDEGTPELEARPQPEAGGPYLGVSGTTVDSEIVDLFDLDLADGAIVAAVGDDTPAAAAGLQRGDVITAIDDQAIATFEDLAAAVAEREPGDTVTLTIVRDGIEQQSDIEIGARPEAGAD